MAAAIGPISARHTRSRGDSQGTRCGRFLLAFATLLDVPACLRACMCRMSLQLSPKLTSTHSLTGKPAIDRLVDGLACDRPAYSVSMRAVLRGWAICVLIFFSWSRVRCPPGSRLLARRLPCSAGKGSPLPYGRAQLPRHALRHHGPVRGFDGGARCDAVWFVCSEKDEGVGTWGA